MNVQIEVPETLFAALNQDVEEFAADARRILALSLLSHHKLTLGQAAELAGMGLYPFMVTCSQAGVDVVDLEKGEVARDLEVLKSLRGKSE